MSEDTNNSMEVKILGVVLGKASGWDQVDDESIFFYDFEPKLEYESILNLKGGFTFDYLEGILTSEDDSIKIHVLQVLPEIYMNQSK